jgi:hypothetical protein
MGRPQPPGEAQLAQLHEAARLWAETLPPVTATDGQAELTLTLNAHSVCLLEIAPT